MPSATLPASRSVRNWATVTLLTAMPMPRALASITSARAFSALFEFGGIHGGFLTVDAWRKWWHDKVSAEAVRHAPDARDSVTESVADSVSAWTRSRPPLPSPSSTPSRARSRIPSPSPTPSRRPPVRASAASCPSPRAEIRRGASPAHDGSLRSSAAAIRPRRCRGRGDPPCARSAATGTPAGGVRRRRTRFTQRPRFVSFRVLPSGVTWFGHERAWAGHSATSSRHRCGTAIACSAAGASVVRPGLGHRRFHLSAEVRRVLWRWGVGPHL